MAARTHVQYFNWPPLGDSPVNKVYLLARGWTKAMIRRLLGEPERQLVNWARRGKIRRKDRPECLYEAERVRSVEATQEFRSWQRRLEQRRDRAEDEFAVPRRFPRWGRPLSPEWVNGVPEEVREAYEKLSYRERSVIDLLFLQGLRQREIAKALRMSQQEVSRVKTRFSSRVEDKYFLRRVPVDRTVKLHPATMVIVEGDVNDRACARAYSVETATP